MPRPRGISPETPTQKQLELLKYIREYVDSRGVMPTLRHLASQFKLTSGAVSSRIFALENKGLLAMPRDGNQISFGSKVNGKARHLTPKGTSMGSYSTSSPTTRQLEVLNFIRATLMGTGSPPTVREIQEHFGFQGPNGAYCHLRALKRQGLLVHLGANASRAWIPSHDAGTCPTCGQKLPEAK